MDRSTVKPYFFVRFRWFIAANIEALYKEFRHHFDIQMKAFSNEFYEKFPYSEAERIRVTADTLTARLSPFRAILYQKQALPFTPKDMKLRERISQLYPRRSSTFGWKREPTFYIAGKDPIPELHTEDPAQVFYQLLLFTAVIITLFVLGYFQRHLV